MAFLDPSGLFDTSATSTVNLNVHGLDKIGITETVELKPIEVKPLTLNENLNVKPLTLNENLDVKPLTLNENLNVKPLTLNENLDIKPLTLNENVNLEPVAVDTCQTLRLAPLPETRVCSPYFHRVRVSLFAMDVMALTFDGHSEQNVHSPRRPEETRRTRLGQPARGATATDHGHAVGGIRVRVLDDHDR